jgi:hypothetical protein
LRAFDEKLYQGANSVVERARNWLAPVARRIVLRDFLHLQLQLKTKITHLGPSKTEYAIDLLYLFS